MSAEVKRNALGSPKFDPAPLATYIAAATTHLGVVPTLTTSFYPPYLLYCLVKSSWVAPLFGVMLAFHVLLAGVLMFFTPGPGWLTIMLALGVLAAEFVWARRLLDRMKEQGLRLRDSVLPREKPGSA